MKRFFDIVLSGLALLVLAPFLIIIALIIKLDSRGPVFFRQVRVGKNNKDFKIFKFRTMKVGSDKGRLITVGGHDSRITRVGYFLRKFKLDEIPQLINVFIGDMSLVGPRPEVRKYVDYWTPEQMHVLDVRPGITDMASIRFSNENELLDGVEDPEEYYVNTIMPQKIAMYLDYVNNQSLWGDVKIIFLTARKIIFGR